MLQALQLLIPSELNALVLLSLALTLTLYLLLLLHHCLLRLWTKCVRKFIYILMIYARNVFTVPLMTFRHIGQCDRDFEHISQHDKWPQGRNTVLIS